MQKQNLKWLLEKRIEPKILTQLDFKLREGSEIFQLNLSNPYKLTTNKKGEYKTTLKNNPKKIQYFNSNKLYLA